MHRSKAWPTQASDNRYDQAPRPVALALIATDLAEVIGTAIGLQLLFNSN